MAKHRLLESTEDGDGGTPRPSPAEMNARGNNDRLARMNRIANQQDARRARQMQDVEGDQITGPFQGGELDDSPEAKERAALEEEDLARQSLAEQEERAREAERLEEEERAQGLQSEGADDTERTPPPARTEAPPADEGDEKVIDGVRYYRCMVQGQERWLSAKELREGVQRGIATEETLQRAQEALRSATQSQPSPKPAADEVDDKDLENIILSASMGDEEATRKLVSVIKARPQTPNVSEEVRRQVTQQIATQRALEEAEGAQEDLLKDTNLGPVFRLRLSQYAQQQPNTKIVDAYRAVGDQMRKDFAAMLSARPGKAPVLPKADRKRTIVTPPRGVGRQPPREDADREVPVSEQIDQIARGRGQQRAHRIRRS